MSVEIARENINLKRKGKIAHTEYSLVYHKEFLKKITGLSENDPDFEKIAYNKLCIDFLFHTNDGLINWEETGRITDMGHAEYSSDGSDKREKEKPPFRTEEDVWEFDAVEEYGLPDFDKQVKEYEKLIEDMKIKFPEQLIPGGYYKTIVSGAIQAFGWEMFLLAASNIGKLERVLDSFFRRTMFFTKAWAETSIEVFIQHDDFVWTSGPFMKLEIYKKIIIPRYASLWKVLHEKGKKVLFCSDGNFMQLAENIVEAGADGLIFEPCNDFGYMFENFGKKCCLVGSYLDCRDLVFGRIEKVKKDIDRTIEKFFETKGGIFAVGNHLSPNIKPEILEQFFEYLIERLQR